MCTLKDPQNTGPKGRGVSHSTRRLSPTRKPGIPLTIRRPSPATSRDHGSIGAGQGTHLPPHTEHPRSPLVSRLQESIRTGRSAANDEVLAGVLNAGTPAVCLVGKSHDFHVTTALGITLEENAENISASVSHLVAQGREALIPKGQTGDAEDGGDVGGQVGGVVGAVAVHRHRLGLLQGPALGRDQRQGQDDGQGHDRHGPAAGLNRPRIEQASDGFAPDQGGRGEDQAALHQAVNPVAQCLSRAIR